MTVIRPKLTEAITHTLGSTPQRASAAERVASRKPQPEMLIGNMVKRPSAGSPTISASRRDGAGGYYHTKEGAASQRGLTV